MRCPGGYYKNNYNFAEQSKRASSTNDPQSMPKMLSSP